MTRSRTIPKGDRRRAGLPSISTMGARPVKCRQCGEKHSPRYRRKGWCLSCDIRDMATTLDAASIAVRLDLPVFLIEAVVG